MKCVYTPTFLEHFIFLFIFYKVWIHLENIFKIKRESLKYISEEKYCKLHLQFIFLGNTITEVSPISNLLRISSGLYSSSNGNIWVNWSSSSTRSNPSGMIGWSLKPSFRTANMTSIMYWTRMSILDSCRMYRRRSKIAFKIDRNVNMKKDFLIQTKTNPNVIANYTYH